MGYPMNPSRAIHFEGIGENHFEMPPDCQRTGNWVCLAGSENHIAESEDPTSIQETCMGRMPVSHCKFHQLENFGLNMRGKII